jgi:DNA-cytosine methyltransferase
MNILSLFDGISCGQIALEKAGIKYDNYYASEIDKHAIKVTQHNYPNTIQLGDVNDWKSWDLPEIDILLAGFPCTSLSCCARQKESGLEKGQSTLFWKLVEVFEFYKPKYFLFENVASMKKTDKDTISKFVGVEPININSSKVSAQNRSRLYWTNIPNVTQPEDKGILLKDIIEVGYTEKDKSYCLTATYNRACETDYVIHKQRQLVYESKEACALSYGRSEAGKKARKEFRELHGFDGGPRNKDFREWVPTKDNKTTTLVSSPGIVFDGFGVRKLTPVECEKLQTVPVNYTDMIPKTQRYKALGNGWTVDVITHILKNLTSF